MTGIARTRVAALGPGFRTGIGVICTTQCAHASLRTDIAIPVHGRVLHILHPWYQLAATGIVRSALAAARASSRKAMVRHKGRVCE